MEKLTITVAQMADLIGVSLPTAYSLTNKQGFPLLQIGRKKLIPVQAFEQWLQAQVESK